ncbi:MAG: ComF family protein [Oscillospiraceae bacterium]|nr:ComF family protein [Oscillospiraceae bacterium]
MRVLLRWLLDLLYPPKCMLCHRLLESSDQMTCGRCDGALPEQEGAGRTVQFFEAFVTPFYYEGYIKDAIRRLKFRGMQTYAPQFARWMAARVRKELEGKYDLISWVPCSGRRKWTRGYDQSELLARALAKELGADCVPTLKKIRHTKKQSKMPSAGARKANVLGAYKAIDPKSVFGKRILLVDDVLTTGATMSECGKTLQLAGSGALVCTAAATRRKT